MCRRNENVVKLEIGHTNIPMINALRNRIATFLRKHCIYSRYKIIPIQDIRIIFSGISKDKTQYLDVRI